MDLTLHLTTRADDSHATPVTGPAELKIFISEDRDQDSRAGKVSRVSSN